MDKQVYLRLLESIKEIAVNAGKTILPISADVGQMQTKEDGSPLTSADLASHNVIERGLTALEPKFNILSEEGDLTQDHAEWVTFWCVDPLDGTKEFVKGLDEYTVNIALIDDGVPVLGVVYVPAQNVLYYASEGGGAWRIDRDGQEERIRARLRETAGSAVVSRSHLSKETEEFLKKLGVSKTVSFGSSLKICAVAEGKADVYPRHGPTCLWDTAAGAAVALEAGCRVVDLDNNDLSYDPRAGTKRSGFIVYPRQLDISAGM